MQGVEGGSSMFLNSTVSILLKNCHLDAISIRNKILGFNLGLE
jgi:hypothetical protein